MKRKLILIGLIFLMMFMMPTGVKAFPELMHESGTETRDCGGGTVYQSFSYTIYDDVDFGGYFNITGDTHEPPSLMAILILDDVNFVSFQTGISGMMNCERLFEIDEITIVTERVAWNYTQYTSVEFNVHIVYWYYSSGYSGQVVYNYEHWDWARYQPPVENDVLPTITGPVGITNGQTCSGIVNIFVTAYHPDGIAVISVATIEVGFICNILDASLLDYDWDTTEYEDGTYTLRITARSNWPDGTQETNWVEYTIHIDNIVETTTDITTTETTSETTTKPITDTTTGESTGEANQSGIVILGIVGIIGIGVIGTIISKHRKKIETISKDAKVLVICPYCGSKTEQGITKCQKCGADL